MNLLMFSPLGIPLTLNFRYGIILFSQVEIITNDFHNHIKEINKMSNQWKETVLQIDAEIDDQTGKDFYRKYRNHRSLRRLVSRPWGEIYHNNENNSYEIPTKHLIRSFDKFCRDYNLERKLTLTAHHHCTRDGTVRYDYKIIDGEIIEWACEVLGNWGDS